MQLQADGKAAPDPSAEPVTEQAITKEDAGASRVGIKKQKIIITQSAIVIQQDGKDETSWQTGLLWRDRRLPAMT